MASVNELLLAAQAKKSPVLSGLEGLAQGYIQGQNQQLDRMKTLIALKQNQEDRRKQEEAQANLRKQLNARQDSAYMQQMNAAGPTPQPVRPQDMVAKFSEDASGNLSATYTDPKLENTANSSLDLQYKQARTDYYKEKAADTAELQSERDYKKRERRNNERVNIVNKFNADASVKKSQQMIDGANIIKDLVVSDNPIAAGAIPTFMARASGEVGNLSEADKAPFGGSRAILTRLEAAAYQAATGKLSPDNARFLKELADIMEKRGNENIGLLAKKRAGQYSRASDFLTEQEIYDTLVPANQAISNVSQDQQQNSQNQNVPNQSDTNQPNKKVGRFEISVRE